MLEWRLLVAWRVDGWHIDILFSGSVQSAASKHGQTVKRSLATVPSRGPTQTTRRVPCENSEISQTPATRVGGHPRPIGATRVGGKLGFRRQIVGRPVALFCHARLLDGSQRSAAVCRTVPRTGTRERAAAGSATSTPTSCADPQGGRPSPVCRDAALHRGRRPPVSRECAASQVERRLSRACCGGGGVLQTGVARGRRAAGDMNVRNFDCGRRRRTECESAVAAGFAMTVTRRLHT